MTHRKIQFALLLVSFEETSDEKPSRPSLPAAPVVDEVPDAPPTSRPLAKTLPPAARKAVGA
jgi:hypothetical protein